ncbi:MAG: biopolymer transporter ExbD [Deltaproteobacteria bacterium]|nr:biopolymer transporter ExbD [Deltaproteobacteria bacterium]MBW1954543.1 biopolymer transporter ExbD [Deltaproteobacteria bacterium]MBW2042598.1 biopolymer transporter ExbD [Deltaproteobacteria bacterium]MBW2132969.1 biopolymer transporter ExbD [Deltaproteobacteria bacterium]
MKLPVHPVKKPRIEMLPLIDIVFLVLVFFIYAMLSMAVHRGVPVVLPVSPTSRIEQKMLLSVTIQSDGTVFVDEEPVPLEDLTEKLKEKTASSPSPGVLLFAENTLAYQTLFSVMDRIRMAGIERISLQAEAEKRP